MLDPKAILEQFRELDLCQLKIVSNKLIIVMAARMFNRRLLCDEYSLLAGKFINFVDVFSRDLILIKPALGNTLGYLKNCGT